MHANRVKQTTTTTGTGTIDLSASAAAGHIKFMDAFETGDFVNYVIEDGDDWEIGAGTITDAATDTLSRDYIYETLVSGTYTKTIDGGGTAITLASGTKDVFVAPTTRSIPAPKLVIPPDPLGLSATDGALSANGSHGGNNTRITSVANELLLTPIFVTAARKFSQIGLRVSTADGGDPDTRVAIYELKADGQPGDTIVESGDLDVSATGLTFSSAFTQDLILPPGLYFGAFLSASSSLAVFGVGRDRFNDFIGIDQFGVFQISAVKSQTAGTFPSEPTGFSYDTQNGVIIYIQ